VPEIKCEHVLLLHDTSAEVCLLVTATDILRLLNL